MSGRQRRLHEPRHARRVALNSRARLLTAITILGSILLGLMLNLGAARWPKWLTENQGVIIGAVGLILWVVIAAYPIVHEVNTHPRPLSGPGKNPEQNQGWDP